MSTVCGLHLLHFPSFQFSYIAYSVRRFHFWVKVQMECRDSAPFLIAFVHMYKRTAQKLCFGWFQADHCSTFNRTFTVCHTEAPASLFVDLYRDPLSSVLSFTYFYPFSLCNLTPSLLSLFVNDVDSAWTWIQVSCINSTLIRWSYCLPSEKGWNWLLVCPQLW